MGSIKVAGKSIEMDEAGYLVNRSNWNEDVAKAMARADGLELTPDHWEIINFVRAHYDEHQTTPNAYVPIRATPENYGLGEEVQKLPNKLPHVLFPGGASQVIKYAGLMKADGPLKYAPAVVSANVVAHAPLGEKYTMQLLDNIKAAGEIQYAFLLAVFDNAIRKPVYYVSSEVNAMAAVLHDGSHYLCTFSAEGHWNLGVSDDWGDPRKFFLRALDIAAEHFGVNPDERAGEESPPPPDLLDAAGTGDVSRVRALLNKGADVNETNEKGATALMWAAGKGDNEIVEVLLAKGADVNAKTLEGLTALLFASNQGHIQTVKVLLNAGADVNAGAEECHTALLAAALTGHTEIIKLLLNAGADVNARAEGGDTALTWASLKGHIETVKVLLEKGADVNARTESGETAMSLATGKGYTEIVQLLTFGQLLTSAEATGKPSEGLGRMNVSEQAPWTAANDELVETIIQGNTHPQAGITKMVKIFARGVNINAKNENGRTALSIAHYYEAPAIIKEVLKMAGGKDSA